MGCGKLKVGLREEKVSLVHNHSSIYFYLVFLFILTKLERSSGIKTQEMMSFRCSTAWLLHLQSKLGQEETSGMKCHHGNMDFSEEYHKTLYEDLCFFNFIWDGLSPWKHGLLSVFIENLVTHNIKIQNNFVFITPQNTTTLLHHRRKVTDIMKTLFL